MPPQTDPIEPTLQPPESGVTVRMYNPGFGDCFLLAFRAEDGTEDVTARYMLIDCGAHQSYSGGAARLREIAADIAKATGNHLHIVAVTHEHWDHLAGFCRARSYFESPMEIDELCLAWPENPDDTDTKRLKELYGKKVKELTAAVEELKQAKDPLADVIEGILDFDRAALLFDKGGFDLGLDVEDVLPAAENSNEAQYQFLKDRSKQKPPPYLQPGDPPLTVPGVKGVKIYVLGPPRDIERIRDTKPGEESPVGPPLLDEWTAFSLGALAARGEDKLGDEDKEAYWRSLPFERKSPYRIPLDDLKKEEADEKVERYRPFFQAHYGLADTGDHAPAWRRIDTDWLTGALRIALRISSYVNNTSLVLAIELTDSEPRKVLLFVGDAQVGNWGSWSEVTWGGDGEGPEVSASDLIQRTVLYKVGHHGSHNATLTEYVEKMSPDLVAMIPVDENWAADEQGWEHPADSVLKALKGKTKGRIIRMDEIPPGDEPPEKPDEATESDWEAFTDQLDWDRSPDKLWIEYTVPG